MVERGFGASRQSCPVCRTPPHSKPAWHRQRATLVLEKMGWGSQPVHKPRRARAVWSSRWRGRNAARSRAGAQVTVRTSAPPPPAHGPARGRPLFSHPEFSSPDLRAQPLTVVRLRLWPWILDAERVTVCPPRPGTMGTPTELGMEHPGP